MVGEKCGVWLCQRDGGIMAKKGLSGEGYVWMSRSGKIEYDRGFTLVELAIVLTIIGLLIAGVLQGQAMIDNARVLKVVSQASAYRGAAIAFKDQYGYYPGDMPNASKYLPNCPPATCDPWMPPAETLPGWGDTMAGNGAVGSRIWATGGGVGLGSYTSQLLHGAGNPDWAGGEINLFWAHLYKAGYITDVTDAVVHDTVSSRYSAEHMQQRGADGIGLERGVTNPATAWDGAFAVGHAFEYSDNWGTPVRADGVYNGGLPDSAAPVGLTFIVSKRMDGCIYGSDSYGHGPTGYLLRPHIARMIDLKVDDGSPLSGTVLGVNCGAGYAIGGENFCNVLFAEGSVFLEGVSVTSDVCKLSDAI